MEFKGQVVFIISYENWGKMLMSKHHYAIELGKLGNKVYFINHPDKRRELKRGQINISLTESENVFAVSHRLIHPYFLKFRYTWLYDLLTGYHIRKIVKAVGTSPDVVWSFDTGNTLPLKSFSKAAVRILMPVDGPFGHKHELNSSIGADVIVSVTDRILATFKRLQKPMLLVNHGVAAQFLQNEYTPPITGRQIRVGYSGSLVRNDLDIETFLKIITKHTDKIFEFWGENDFKKSNIHLPQDISTKTLQFLDTLSKLPNVIMHGSVSTETLAKGISQMDALLICYNIKNDQNHHKVLEYLGTGKVIISNFLSSYKDHPGLLEMIHDDQDNTGLTELFDKVIGNLERYNSKENQEKRMAFAREYSYSSNITRIQNFINRALKR